MSPPNSKSESIITIADAVQAIRKILKERSKVEDTDSKELRSVAINHDHIINVILTWIESELQNNSSNRVSLAIVIEAGKVARVVSDHPAIRGKNYRVIDHDIDDLDDEDVYDVIDESGHRSLAKISVGEVSPSSVDYNNLEPSSKKTPAP